MERRLGRIQAGHPQVSDLYDLALRDTPHGLRLQWSIKEDRKVWRGLREGAYMLRTNLQAGTAAELWSRYMQLAMKKTVGRCSVLFTISLQLTAIS